MIAALDKILAATQGWGRAIRTQQEGLTLSINWEMVLSADDGRNLIEMQNNHASAEVLYVFGSNPSDAQALRLPVGATRIYDTKIPSGALWMRSTVAMTTPAVVLLNG